MIDLLNLMNHLYYIDIEPLDNKTQLLTFIDEPGDHDIQFTINNEQLAKLRFNIIKLEKLLTIK